MGAAKYVNRQCHSWGWDREGCWARQGRQAVEEGVRAGGEVPIGMRMNHKMLLGEGL